MSTIENLNPNIKKNVQLSQYNWFNLGGPAELFFKPQDKKELIEIIRFSKDKNLKINVIGAGSNTLIRDKGIKGLTIKLGKSFSTIKLLDNEIIEVGASTLDKKVANFAQENSISGFEFLSCIPGSLGGAVIMNSGCYGEDISKVFLSLKAVNFMGEEIEIKRENIKFFYRNTNLPNNLIITSVVLKGKQSSKENINKKQSQMIETKKKSQPSSVKTCGSTFKNPKGEKAWELIKKSQCANLSVGDAKISEKHSNFFINNGKATSEEIESLITKVRDQVFKKTGINLELEIKIVGD